jgi:hypothetical protein
VFLLPYAWTGYKWLGSEIVLPSSTDHQEPIRSCDKLSVMFKQYGFSTPLLLIRRVVHKNVDIKFSAHDAFLE